MGTTCADAGAAFETRLRMGSRCARTGPVATCASRSPGADGFSAPAYGRHGLTDDAGLHPAGEEGRCLATCNRGDFIRLTVADAKTSRAHAGPLIVPWTFPPGNAVAVAQALLAHHRDHPDGLPPYIVVWSTFSIARCHSGRARLMSVARGGHGPVPGRCDRRRPAGRSPRRWSADHTKE
jgi:hypothetical protein